MTNAKHLVFILTLSLLCTCPVRAWFWPFSDDEPVKHEADGNQGKHLVRSPVPFEMTGAEEKFLEEAKKYMGDLTPLDSCHQITINRIKKSCGDIHEEELGKLGVQLFNCQAMSEKRRTYKCSEEMTLAECTSDMDVATWNGYHIISNRARSICYATRQQQFRLKTEYTVNQLALQAIDHLRLMENLKSGQSQLVNLASDTVKTVTAGQDRLIGQQRKLSHAYKSTQKSIASGIRNNLHALGQEKALITEGRQQLTDMTEKLNDKLELATAEMSKHESSRKESHKQILDDLGDVRTKAQDVWDKIDESTEQMFTYHKESADHYSETIENLKKMNSTISYLLEAIDSMQTRLDDRITWLAEQFGGTGDKLGALVTCALHAGFFLVATFSILFLKAPMFTRLVLLIMVPVNAWCEIKLQSSLPYGSLTILLSAVLVGNWLYYYLKRRFQNASQKCIELSPSSPVFALRDNNYSNVMRHSVSGSPFDSTCNDTFSTSPYYSPSPDSLACTRRQLDMSLPHQTSTPRRGNRPTTPRRRCSGTTKTGSVCKKMSMCDSGYCHTHSRM